MVYVLFIVGFVLLIKGADYLVEGASAIAKRNHIPELVIGLTIVSFGTSMPELIVNLLASFDGSSELAIGNVLGSNIANVLLILGVAALIKPLPIQKSIYFTEIPISLFATVMVGFLANADLFVDVEGLTLSRYDGVILLFFFGLFMTYIYVVSKNPSDKPEPESEVDENLLPRAKSIIYVVAGSLALFLGGKWVVDGAFELSLLFGLSETFIGLTVVAIGTSLPELVTSAMAARKGQADLAVGNVVGSSIFNLLWILGLSSVIRPLPFDVVSNSDILMVIASSTLLITAIVIGGKARIGRFMGFVFVLVYLAYLVYLVLRG
ncbi:calcium/sodium antiporter [Gilvimarinus agarilyticus]|uniref:Cation:H+ antiporter n=1 Tax=Reichenbachiella agariperforans TaxID=156994 RepID=A0A1M6K3X8_REIAG|nr:MULTISPECIES: calcium/sodium antiporter [Reichenbachiella]MBU2887961.1 calcium/sodium antiporter [Gilvimarinus agarilyticus]MBU2913409.1 calcium/sodium antiporter [Reichenbachiella agariperforans]RJE74613.1 sodium:proton exchanger [Reichenbachiella sp. MSK19-1]SHJ53580.1 cation:H+ antiporter [Reichenbachiella agariperforans]